MTTYSRILLDGVATYVEPDGDELVAGDGRRIPEAAATYLPPTEPSKIICVHLNHVSRVREFQIQLPAAPTYFQKPTSALNAQRGAVVRPDRCRWLNYEGEVVVVIGRPW
jgi:5-oxopent-3-ene-1,2,5-tricarboxylate decarboxylase / 2-hydroxyhepta-2,4-diene-1,7-dioate isomerase